MTEFSFLGELPIPLMSPGVSNTILTTDLLMSLWIPAEEDELY